MKKKKKKKNNNKPHYDSSSKFKIYISKIAKRRRSRKKERPRKASNYA
jgi:hypothetical protein